MHKADGEFFIIGHRGAAGERLENSLAGFRHALKLDIDAIELDVREQGGTLWVFHDHQLERLTGIAESFESQTDIGAIKLNNSEPLPSLQQVLDLVWGKISLIIEMKSVVDVQLLLDLLAEYPPLEAPTGLPWILISSFNHQKLLELRQLDCEWPLALINLGVPIHVDHVIRDIAPYSWHFRDEDVDFDLVRQLHGKDVLSLVFTVNDAERASFLKQNGIGGIFTDIPSTLQR